MCTSSQVSPERGINRYALLDVDKDIERLSTLFPQDYNIALQTQNQKWKPKKIQGVGTNEEEVGRKDDIWHGAKEEERRQWK